MTALNAQLEALNAKVANPKISMAGAAKALADAAAVDAALSHLDDKGRESGGSFSKSFEEGVRSDGGFFGNKFTQTALGGLKGTLLTGVASALAALPALGAIGGVGLVGGLGAMVAAKIPGVASQFKALGTSVMGTLTKAVQPMVPFLTSVTKQVGGFVSSIGPQLSGLFAAVGPMLQPLVSGLESLVRGLLPGLSAILKAAMPAVQAFAQVLGTLGGDIGSMFRAFAPAVAASATVMKALFGVLGGLLPVLAKLASSLAGVLAPVITQLAGLFSGLAPVIGQIGRVIGEFAQALLVNLAGGLQAAMSLIRAITPSLSLLAGAFGKVFQLLNNRGVLNDLEDALEQLSGPLANLINALVAGLVPALPVLISLLSSAAALLQTGMVTVIAGLADAFTALVKAIPPGVMEAIGVGLGLWVTYAKLLGPAKAVISGFGSAFSFVTGLPAKIAELASKINLAGIATKVWTGIQAAFDAVMDANPIMIVVLAIVALVAAVVLAWTHFKAFRDVVKDAMHDIAAAVETVFGWIKTHWPLLLAILTGPVGLAVLFITGHWHQITAGAQQMFRDVVSFFTSLPGRILSALGDLGSLLFGSGKKIIQGLINGVKSMVGDVGNAIGSVVGEVKSFLPFSPAKKGPLSGGGAPVNSGRSIARQIAQGLTGGMGDITQAMNHVAGAVNPRGGYGGYAGGGGGGSQNATLTLKIDASDSEFMQALMKRIRVMGGDPAMFQKKVVFR
jgi:phage-related protein